jgi:hypothetical protein
MWQKKQSQESQQEAFCGILESLESWLCQLSHFTPDFGSNVLKKCFVERHDEASTVISQTNEEHQFSTHTHTHTKQQEEDNLFAF